jgi:hypothetical protein
MTWESIAKGNACFSENEVGKDAEDSTIEPGDVDRQGSKRPVTYRTMPIRHADRHHDELPFQKGCADIFAFATFS